jgi:hypothetical protein
MIGDLPGVGVETRTDHVGGRFGRLGPFLVEGGQAGFGLGQDLPVDQAFQLGSDAFDVFGTDAEAERLADVLRPQVGAGGLNTARICW